MRILVTGGCGFIGSNLLCLLVPKHPEHQFLNLDALTYAANPKNLADIDSRDNYEFEKVDISDASALHAEFVRFRPELVIHLAAESHVDRSIHGPDAFVRTNIQGTFNLLESAREVWQQCPGLFHHVSTDEVYGSLDEGGFFTETTAYDPSSPYSASKASSDHLVRSYGRTYGMRTRITNSSNNYGPMQFPEKLVPLMISNMLAGKPLPIYGTGLNVRDWIHVGDHCEAIWKVACAGKDGESYNIGGNSPLTNIDVVNCLCKLVAEKTGRDESALRALITYVEDRPGHDLRYAIDASKIERDLGVKARHSFEEGLSSTVQWYLDNPQWVAEVLDGSYQDWIETNYRGRGDDN